MNQKVWESLQKYKMKGGYCFDYDALKAYIAGFPFWNNIASAYYHWNSKNYYFYGFKFSSNGFATSEVYRILDRLENKNFNFKGYLPDFLENAFSADDCNKWILAAIFVNYFLDFGLSKDELKNITLETVKNKSPKYLDSANDLFNKIDSLDWADPENYIPLEIDSWKRKILYNVPSLMEWEVKNPNPVLRGLYEYDFLLKLITVDFNYNGKGSDYGSSDGYFCAYSPEPVYPSGAVIWEIYSERFFEKIFGMDKYYAKDLFREKVRPIKDELRRQLSSPNFFWNNRDIEAYRYYHFIDFNAIQKMFIGEQ